MLDMIFVVHSPSDVPPRLWGFASTAWIGATDALVNRSQVKTHSAAHIILQQLAVAPGAPADVAAVWMAGVLVDVFDHYGVLLGNFFEVFKQKQGLNLKKIENKTEFNFYVSLFFVI